MGDPQRWEYMWVALEENWEEKDEEAFGGRWRPRSQGLDFWGLRGWEVVGVFDRGHGDLVPVREYSWAVGTDTPRGTDKPRFFGWTLLKRPTDRKPERYELPDGFPRITPLGPLAP